MVVYVYRKSRPGRRVAFCVSKKIGSAVLRNRIRRRLREVYRLNREKLSSRCDLILLARPGAARTKFAELQKAFLGLASRAGAIKEEGPRVSQPAGPSS